MLISYLPVRVISETNIREHWAKRAKRTKAQRLAGRLAFNYLETDIIKKWPKIIITLTRLAPRKLDDDNLAAGFKHIRDGIADALDIDDGSDRIVWRYNQKKSKGENINYGVIVQADYEQ